MDRARTDRLAVHGPGLWRRYRSAGLWVLEGMACDYLLSVGTCLQSEDMSGQYELGV